MCLLLAFNDQIVKKLFRKSENLCVIVSGTKQSPALTKNVNCHGRFNFL